MTRKKNRFRCYRCLGEFKWRSMVLRTWLERIDGVLKVVEQWFCRDCAAKEDKPRGSLTAGKIRPQWPTAAAWRRDETPRKTQGGAFESKKRRH
ncbi:MAG TPA: hypothetical protein VLJ79_11275 [Candidatus Binatia bacterium]|nr:hypothetical protein [Candidatus Binatia bacterium]